MTQYQNLKFGYLPLFEGDLHPGDRRRFYFFARNRGVHYETVQPNAEYDIVFLTQAADVSVWSHYPRGKTKIVYDLVDSYLTLSRTDPKALLRGTAKYFTGQSKNFQPNFWKSLREMCKRADAVVCTTEEQKEAIQEFCPNVHIILDAHSSVASTIKTDYRSGKPFKLVWEGLPQNVESFQEIASCLKRIQRNYDIELHLVTDLKFGQYMGKYLERDTQKVAEKYFKPSFVHEWNEKTCATIITNCDLAVIPIPLMNPLAVGKPENKLILLWRMGIPTLVSATPAYIRAMDAANINMVCPQAGDWEILLEEYMNSEEMRRKAGQQGIEFVRNNFSDNNLLQKWDQLFDTLI